MASTVECWVCGKKHEYCEPCHRLHGWKYVADTPEHYQVYITIEEFRKGILTKEQAISVLSEKCNVNAEDDLSWMLPNVEKGVRDIIGYKNKPATKTKNALKE